MSGDATATTAEAPIDLLRRHLGDVREVVNEPEPVYGMSLFPQHQALLTASGIPADIARERGYVSIDTKVRLERLGFARYQLLVPGLLIPVHGVTGEVVLHEYRPDTPRVVDGKPNKYEKPERSKNALDVPPRVRQHLDDPRTPLFFTEGARKADAAAARDICCIALMGVFGWRGKGDKGGTRALPDFEHIALNGRQVYIVFDSDVTSKAAVRTALRRFVDFLEHRKATVTVLCLPEGPNGEKVGLDDYLAAGHSTDELLGLAWELPSEEEERATLEAVELEARVTYERRVRAARRIVDDEEQVETADLGAIDVASAADLLKRERPERVRVLGDLLFEGHNATAVAQYKIGKTTFIENMAAAITSGGTFLARYPVESPLRVVLLNYELDPDDTTDRLRALDLDAEAMERLLVVNLRGHRLPLMTDLGRRWLASILDGHGAKVLLVDPFGAAFAAAGGVDENKNTEVRRFLIALDEAKREAGCPTLVMPIHTGRGEQAEGAEHGRGATVLDDWPDLRILLTRDREGRRYLRAEGRRDAQALAESRLQYDPVTRGLWLGEGDLGVGRRAARAEAHVGLVVDVVALEAGINTAGIEDALAASGITANEEKRGAIRRALQLGRVHRHPGVGRSQLHYLGGDHDQGEACPGGWRSA